jgi:hypothetical protein
MKKNDPVSCISGKTPSDKKKIYLDMLRDAAT